MAKAAVRSLQSAISAAVLLLAAGCDHTNAALQATASDQWVRSYDLSPGGEMQIVGGNGTVDVRGGSGVRVEVNAERITKAFSASTAKEVLPRVRIREDITPEKIVLQTEALGGLVIGVEVSVNYRVTVPPGTRVRVRTENGAVTLTGLDAQVVGSSANGPLTATALSGGADLRTVNGNLNAELSAFGRDPVDLRTVNGQIDLAVPADINANVNANVTNGAIDVTDLALELQGDQTRRRVRGRMNAGGSPIEAIATNGAIRIHRRQ